MAQSIGGDLISPIALIRRATSRVPRAIRTPFNAVLFFPSNIPAAIPITFFAAAPLHCRSDHYHNKIESDRLKKPLSTFLFASWLRLSITMQLGMPAVSPVHVPVPPRWKPSPSWARIHSRLVSSVSPVVASIPFIQSTIALSLRSNIDICCIKVRKLWAPIEITRIFAC